MKIICNRAGDIRRLRGMTFVELMVSLCIFTMLIAAFMTVHLFGMRQDQLVSSEMGANDQSRPAFNLILDEIRSAKNVQIGSGAYSNFVAITNGAQQGPSLQIISSTDPNQVAYYWFDTNKSMLFRAGVSNSVMMKGTNSVTIGIPVSTNVVAQYLTNMTSPWLSNSMMFRAMDYTGTNVLTNDPVNMTTYNNNYTVAILLQFAQFQYPLTKVGSNSLYTYYQLTYSATRRNP